MSKRKKKIKNKKKREMENLKKFPEALMLGSQEACKEDAIILTDAGKDWVDKTQIYHYLEDPELLEQKIEEFEEIEELEEIENIEIITARAVFANYFWIQIITLMPDDRDFADGMITQHEETAIKLGLAMRDYIGDDHLIVVNDSQHAVGNFNGWGFLPPDQRIIKEEKERLKQQSHTVLWAERKSVRLADQLKLHQATKIFSSDIFDPREELGLEEESDASWFES
jgi:hypothetical protein